MAWLVLSKQDKRKVAASSKLNLPNSTNNPKIINNLFFDLSRKPCQLLRIYLMFSKFPLTTSTDANNTTLAIANYARHDISHASIIIDTLNYSYNIFF